MGFNSAGVGVAWNAIAARGTDFRKLPTHLSLRTVLESSSLADARRSTLKAGVASAYRITIRDGDGGSVGLECTAFDVVKIEMENGSC